MEPVVGEQGPDRRSEGCKKTSIWKPSEVRGNKGNQILFVNLEDINADKKAFIFLDEIHRKEGWEFWIRKKYDLKTNVKFIISGSCSYLLKREYSTLLTGRNITFEVFPLSFEEFLTFKNMSLDKTKLKKGIVTEKTRLEILMILYTRI